MEKVTGTRHEQKLQGGGEGRGEDKVNSAMRRDTRGQTKAKRNPLDPQFLVTGLDKGKDHIRAV